MLNEWAHPKARAAVLTRTFHISSGPVYSSCSSKDDMCKLFCYDQSGLKRPDFAGPTASWCAMGEGHNRARLC
jgi:hypothetical protein